MPIRRNIGVLIELPSVLAAEIATESLHSAIMGGGLEARGARGEERRRADALDCAMSGLTRLAFVNPGSCGVPLASPICSGMSPDFLSGLLFSIFVNNIQPKSVVIAP